MTSLRYASELLGQLLDNLSEMREVVLRLDREELGRRVVSLPGLGRCHAGAASIILDEDVGHKIMKNAVRCSLTIALYTLVPNPSDAALSAEIARDTSMGGLCRYWIVLRAKRLYRRTTRCSRSPYLPPRARPRISRGYEKVTA